MVKKIITGSFLTNTYLIIHGTECVIVDPGLDFKEHAESILKDYTVKAILLTHGHMDHIDGIRYFNVPIYIHEQELAFLKDESLSLYRMFGIRPPFQIENLNIKSVKDGMTLNLIGYTFKVMHTPGHTRGSVVYSFSNKIFSGDTLFHMSMGRTDFPTGDAKKMKESLQKIIQSFPDQTNVYPGHDEKTTIGMERKNNPYV